MSEQIFVAHATGVSSEDGKSRMVTVVCRRYTEIDSCWDDTVMKEKDIDQTHFVYSLIKEKTNKIALGYSIQNPEDMQDNLIGIERAIHRSKHNPYYAASANGKLRESSCQAITDAEAKHIAEHIDGFINKLKRL